jgi:AraC-like DNA-binding protein
MQGAHSFGSDLLWCDLDGIRISETLMPPGLTLTSHAHEPGQVCVVLEGAYRERTDRGMHHLRPGGVQLHAPGETHANVFGSEEVLTLLLSFSPERWPSVPTSRPAILSVLLSSLAREVRAELRREDAVSRTALEGLSLLLLSHIHRAEAGFPEGEPEWLQDAVAWIERHYAARISLSAVAHAIGVHRTTLACALRKHRLTSVGELIRKTRVQHAMRALMTTNASVSEIAATHGFSDQAHLSRLLRNLHGVSPTDLRKCGERSTGL